MFGMLFYKHPERATENSKWMIIIIIILLLNRHRRPLVFDDPELYSETQAKG